jgi:hypothetical protein
LAGVARRTDPESNASAELPFFHRHREVQGWPPSSRRSNTPLDPRPPLFSAWTFRAGHSSGPSGKVRRRPPRAARTLVRYPVRRVKPRGMPGGREFSRPRGWKPWVPQVVRLQVCNGGPGQLSCGSPTPRGLGRENGYELTQLVRGTRCGRPPSYQAALASIGQKREQFMSLGRRNPALFVEATAGNRRISIMSRLGKCANAQRPGSVESPQSLSPTHVRVTIPPAYRCEM